MFNKKTFLFMVVLGVIAMVIGAAGSYLIFNEMPSVKESELSNLIESSVYEESQDNVEQKTIEPETSQVSTVQKITPSTKIVYQYYYEEDGIMEEQEDVPTYFLLDLTLSDMLQYYPEWDIVSFSAEKVVLRKNIDGKSSQHYVIGEKDGYVAVFYEEEQDGISLREVTDVPVSALPEDEQNNLKAGIFVIGDDKLAEAIQNYES